MDSGMMDEWVDKIIDGWIIILDCIKVVEMWLIYCYVCE